VTDRELRQVRASILDELKAGSGDLEAGRAAMVDLYEELGLQDLAEWWRLLPAEWLRQAFEDVARKEPRQ
jgi:hypothetical protein